MMCVASRSRVDPESTDSLLSTNSMMCEVSWSRVDPNRVNRFVIIN